jgi:hypothetical protein
MEDQDREHFKFAMDQLSEEGFDIKYDTVAREYNID